MNRTALYFGLWAALCMAVAIVTFFIIADMGSGETFRDTMFDGPAPSVRPILFLLPFCVPAAIVAGLGWAILHRKGHRPGWLGYGLLAVLVVVLSHIVVFGTIALTADAGDRLQALSGIGFIFMVHGWVSVPMALLGTFVFVLWTRRHRAVAT